LPGLFGSGVGELYELKRLLVFMRGLSLPVELCAEAARLHHTLLERQNITDPFEYWKASAGAKEEYREAVGQTLSGETETISADKWNASLDLFLARIGRGLLEVEAMAPLVPTYLTYEPSGLDAEGLPSGFICRALPTFLEGPARQLKTAPEKARDVYRAVRGCDLYDTKLGMFKTSVSLEGETYDIGRIRSFTPGWLERESVFMHMSFKYLLELLKAGLVDEFFREIKTSLPPFMDPAVYGRNPLENSSFIASSHNPDPKTAGRGFVARLSGSTAEMLSVWRHLFLGGKGFHIGEDGQLRLTLAPVLPSWFFPEDGMVWFHLFRTVRITYSNPARSNTYGADGAKPRRCEVVYANGDRETFEGGSITGRAADAVRQGLIESITVDMS
jgi:hypothetical protein